MRYRIIVFLVITLSVAVQVHADCMNDSYGRRMCGKGQCKMSQYGKVLCAREGGGAANNKNDNVQCGIGYCIVDDYNRVWCSTIPGGKAYIDENGKIVCAGECERGKASYCEDAKVAED